MRKYKIQHTDSFTNVLFGGNPTVTVLEADSLSDFEMKQIAKEMNLSETGFVLKSDKADFRFRFFTPPGSEIKFCGHATLGALSTLAGEGLLKSACTIETNAGILKVEVDGSRFIFDAPKIELVPSSYTIEDVANDLGISKELLDSSKKVMLEKTNNYLYLTARNLECLGKIEPNVPQSSRFAEKDRIVVFCILTNETFDLSNHIHARGFAPLVGVPEDPFTGSMQGGLAAYVLNQNLIAPSNWIRVEQGHFMSRPGFVDLEITQMAPIQVKLHAEAVPVFVSEVTLKSA